MALSSYPTVEEGHSRDLLLARNEILVVPIVPSLLEWGSAVAVVIVSIAAFRGMPFIGLPAALGGVYVLTLIFKQVATIKRRRLYDASYKEFAKRSERRIPWSEVKGAELRRARLTIRTERKKYTTAMRQSDVEAIKQLMGSKLGKRFVDNT